MAFELIGNTARKRSAQMKDLLPPISRHRIPAALVIPRAAYWFHLAAAVAAMLFIALHLGRASYSVNLAWDANPEPDIARYKVYWGLQSGTPTKSLEVGKVTTATVANLDEGTTYFFTVTAINAAGLESGPSNEVSYTTPSPPPQVYTLTVVRGSGSGRYPPGRFVPVHAEPPKRGEKFGDWDGDTQILQRPRTEEDNEAFTIERDVTITATYTALPSFVVTVTHGSGDGNYYAGETVAIVADATSNQQFAGWTGNAFFADPSSSTTTFTMPASDVSVTATYSSPEYPLTVTNGTGSGNYLADTEVTIVANAAPAGQQFAAWTGNVNVANPTSPTTTLKMPAYAASITATYRVRDRIRYYPRSGYLSRMVGGVFEGTNGHPETGTYTQIHTITATPSLAWKNVNVNLGDYRYLRYRGPDGSYGNVAEIEFYRDGIKIQGTGYGTAGSWENLGGTFQMALDGKVNTFFDGPTANGNYVGIDRGSP
jgi:Divergent InlB B-repeat domain/Fibronectin type III domain